MELWNIFLHVWKTMKISEMKKLYALTWENEGLIFCVAFMRCIFLELELKFMMCRGILSMLHYSGFKLNLRKFFLTLIRNSHFLLYCGMYIFCLYIFNIGRSTLLTLLGLVRKIIVNKKLSNLITVY